MNATVIARRAVLAGTVALLLVLAWWAVFGAVNQFARVRTVGQAVETVVQLVCASLSVAAVVTSRRAAAAIVWRAWAVSLMIMAVLASLVWGPPMLLPPLVFGAAALIIVALVRWALRFGRGR